MVGEGAPEPANGSGTLIAAFNRHVAGIYARGSTRKELVRGLQRTLAVAPSLQSRDFVARLLVLVTERALISALARVAEG